MWNRTENQIELWLIRHGLTPSNEEHRYLGRTDEPLGKNGIRQLQKKKVKPADMVFCGPMLRCRQSAALLFPEKKPLLVEPWREMDFGTFEGKTYRELSGDREYQRWIDSGGTLPFPGGESREELMERSIQGFSDMMTLVAERMEEQKKSKIPVAAVLHGGNIMSIMSRLTGEDYFDFQIKNGEEVHLIFQGDQLLSWEIDRSL